MVSIWSKQVIFGENGQNWFILDHDFRDKNVPIIPEKMGLVDFKRLEYTFKCISYGVRRVVSLLQVITRTQGGSISKNGVFCDIWGKIHDSGVKNDPINPEKNIFTFLK